MIKKLLTLILTLAITLTCVYQTPQSLYVIASEESQLDTYRKIAASKYLDKAGFDISLENQVFDGNTGIDYSTDTDTHHFMEVLNQLRTSNNDQTIVFRFKTTKSTTFLFGMGSDAVLDDGRNMLFGLENGKLRIVFRSNTNGALKGSFGSQLADGKWHTVALSMEPSKGMTNGINAHVIIDGGSELYPASWSASHIGGLNQKSDIPYTLFQIGKGSFASNSGLRTGGNQFEGEIDFISIVDTAYDVAALQSITQLPPSPDFDNIASIMSQSGTNHTWLFTGGDETVADFNTILTGRNYVGLFEDNLRTSGTYVERSRFVFNTAKKGANIATLLEEYDTRIKSHGAKTVAIMIGAHDYNQGENGITTFKTHLNDLIQRIASDGMIPMILTPYPSHDTKKQNNINLYTSLVKEVAQNQAKVIDLSSITLSNIDNNGYLTQLGHQEVANTIKRQLGLSNITNYSFQLDENGHYSVAKSTNNQLSEIQVVSSKESLSVSLDKSTIKDNDQIYYDIIDENKQMTSARAILDDDTFMIEGLKENKTYTLSVYEMNGNIKETYKSIKITLKEGAKATVLDYDIPLGNNKIKALLNSDQPVKYLFVGNSITHGILTQGYDNVPQLFAKYLNELGRDEDIVINVGVSNATVSTTHDQFEHRIAKHNPDVVMIMLGTNDSSVRGEYINGQSYGVNNFKSYYKALVEDIYKMNPNTSIVLRVPPEMIVDAAHSEYLQFFGAIDEVVLEMKEKYSDLNIVLVDHAQDWKNYESTVRNDNIKTTTDGWLVDNVHPNGRGNIAMFKHLVKELGIYDPASFLANFEYGFTNSWEIESDIVVDVEQNGTQFVLSMNDLSQYESLKNVTLTLSDTNNTIIKKTEDYNSNQTLTISTNKDETYTILVTGKDSKTNKTVLFDTRLIVEDKTNIDNAKKQLQALLNKTINEKDYTLDSYKTYKHIKEQALQLLLKEQVTYKELIDMIDSLQESIDHLIPLTFNVGDLLVLDESKEYIIYNAYDQNNNLLNANERLLFDSGGANVGWLKYEATSSLVVADKYVWTLNKADNSHYYLHNKATGFEVLNTLQSATNSSDLFVVSDKSENAIGDSYRFVVRDIQDGQYFVTIESVDTNKLIAPENGTGNRTYAVFKDDATNKNNWWVIKEAPKWPTVEGSTNLFDSPDQSHYYRIPAITTANNGDLIAVTDLRYYSNYDLGNNWPGHPRGHQIDLLTKISNDNGANWSNANNITKGYSIADDGVNNATGYGDAAIVADRESDEVLILAASGTYGFVSSGKQIKASALRSYDNGQTFSAPSDIQDEIYKLNNNFQAFFFASGRIMQSRYIKVGDYYRIYSAILAHTGNFNNKANWVVYSDDFGRTWNILGDASTSCVPAGDEAKIEELPDGSVVISSRKNGGRYFNIFKYNDTSYSQGSWDKDVAVTMGNGQGTNGEIMVVYAKNKKTNEYTYLALQSLPVGSGRTEVSIYYKELDQNAYTSSSIASGWNDNNKFLVQQYESAYSTMSLQANGQIAFFFEESPSCYDMVYKAYSLEEITNDQYEIAFNGIGSIDTPYIVNTKEQEQAMKEIYAKEQVHFLVDVECEHEWEDDYTIDKKPTYTQEGSKSIHCKNCDEVKDITSIPKLEKPFPFTDVSNKQWYYGVISEAYQLGLMTGATETLFKPNANMNRGMVAIVFHRMEGSKKVEYSSIFPDVANKQYYTTSVLWAKQTGVINGYKDGTFKPLRNVTREEMATMIYNFARYKGLDMSASKDITYFSDYAKITPYARVTLQWAVEKGLMSGKLNGTKLDPLGTATRAECSKMLVQAYKVIYK